MPSYLVKLENVYPSKQDLTRQAQYACLFDVTLSLLASFLLKMDTCLPFCKWLKFDLSMHWAINSGWGTSLTSHIQTDRLKTQ